MFAARVALQATTIKRTSKQTRHGQMAFPRSFSSLGFRGILVLDLGNGISGFAKSNEHSLGEMNAFFVTFRDLVPLRAVPRTGMINESGFDGACYDNKGVF
jgi:hypothetical protein